MADGWSRLGGWIGIPTGGVGIVLRRMAFHAVFVAGVTQVKSASNALYLSHRDPEGLALLYILVAATVAAASALLSRGLRGRRPLELLRHLGLGMAVLLLVLFGLLQLDLAPVFGLVYVLGELYATVLSVLFWADSSERFDVRAQKRIVGLLAAGGMLGAILGGGLVAPLARWIGVDGLVALSGLTLAAALPLLGGDFRERRQREREPVVRRSALGALLVDRYPRHIALLVGSLSVLATLVDYHFRTSSAVHLGEGELASLFGQLNAVVGVAGLAFQAMFTPRLLAMFGVFVFLGLIPALSGLLALAIQFSSLFALTIVLKAVEMAGSYSLYQPGLQLLYNPIEPTTRHALRPLIDGAAKKLGVAVGGLALIGLSASQARGVVLPAVVVTVVAIVLLLRSLRHGFIATLDQRLGARRPQVHAAIDASDKVTRAALLRALRSESSREVLTALSILERADDYDAAEDLQHLLVHNSETVRLAAIERARSSQDPALAQALSEILATDARVPRARAARALALVDPAGAADALRPYLYDPDPGVQVAVVAALLPLEEDGEGPAHALLGNLVATLDHPAPVKRELCKLLGELSDAPFDEALSALLHDADPSVRQLACQAAARLQREVLLDDLIALLGDRAVRQAARAALAAYGDRVVPRLGQLLDDRGAPLGLRLEIPRVLRAIGSAEAARALLFSNIVDDATLRYRIASALFDLARTHPSVGLDRARIDEAARRRLKAYRYYRPTLRALQAARDPAYAPLTRAVRDRESQNLEMALRLIGLSRDAERMRHVFAALDGREVGMRAEALELLDVALAGDPMRGELLRYVEEETLPGNRPADEVRELMHSRDPLLRGIALVVAERLDIEISSVGVRAELVDMEGETMDRPFIDRLLLLEHVDLFARLSMDDLAALAAITTERALDPGQVLYREGDAGDAMFVIVEGEVELIKGDTVILKLRAGETIGQVSFMDGGPRPVTARAVAGQVGARLLTIERPAFMDLLADRFELVTGLFAVLAQRLRTLIELTGQHGDGPKAGREAEAEARTASGVWQRQA